MSRGVEKNLLRSIFDIYLARKSRVPKIIYRGLNPLRAPPSRRVLSASGARARAHTYRRKRRKINGSIDLFVFALVRVVFLFRL